MKDKKHLPRFIRDIYYCRLLVLISIQLFFIFLSPFSGIADPSADSQCSNCHSDPDLAVDRKGINISLYVDEASFTKSVHAPIGCIGCHLDADVKEFPHPEGLKEVDCSGCHKIEFDKFQASIHGQALKRGAPYAPTCASCHGKHDILGHIEQNSPTHKINIPVLCGKCHKEGEPVSKIYNISAKDIIGHYRESIHGEGLLKKGLLVTATCYDCHSSHEIYPHTATESTVSALNVAKTCSKCHGMIEQVHTKIIRGELWEKSPNSIPACVDCHSAHEIRKDSLVRGMADDECLSCHEKEKPFVNKGEISSSAHNKISCIKCHSDISPGHERPCDTAGRIDCSNCHVKQGEDFTESIHGQLLAKKDPDAPTCTECHGAHNIATKLDDQSPIFRRNVPNLCAKCHLEGQKAAKRVGPGQANLLQRYRDSTHGKGVIESGLISSAICTDCHTSHREFPSKDSRSSVHHANIAKTCAKCHRGIFEKFSKSIHSPTISKSTEKLPACPDCHSSHDISRVEKDKFMHEVSYQCGSCHKEVAETYFQTYHGKAYQLGSTRAAKCSDCHGTHDILPPSDPASHLSHNNVVKTCGKCHSAANRKFTGYLTHATHHDRIKYPILFYTFWGMTSLLVGTFGFFGLHTLLWLPKSFARLKQKRKAQADENAKYYLRFELRERLLHLSVIISFFGLAITGMMQKFSNMAWASSLAGLIGGVGAAGFIHRVCAIITFGYFVSHIYILYCRKKENNLSLFKMIFNKNTMLPTITDIIEFFQTMRWFLGFGERPRYGRWTYWEKFDYFAVFWGVGIIGSTGLILWFPELFTLILPGWLINVATIIHSDEALLAVGFIFTIHFFNTHLRPEAFPMDPVIFSGRISLEELEHDRPREFEELKQSPDFEKYLAPPMPEDRMKLIYIFGLSCLGVGILQIVLIIYSMLFGYN